MAVGKYASTYASDDPTMRSSSSSVTVATGTSPTRYTASSAPSANRIWCRSALRRSRYSKVSAMFTSGAGITCVSWCNVRWRTVSQTVTKSFSSPRSRRYQRPSSSWRSTATTAPFADQPGGRPAFDDGVAGGALLGGGDVGDGQGAVRSGIGVSGTRRGARR